MNQHTASPPIDPETIIAALAEVYPKTMSITTMQGKLHAKRQRIESGLLLLVAQGRVKTATFNTVATVYRLSEDESVKQGFKRENPVRNSYELLTTRPAYVPPRMTPSRSDASDFQGIFSRSGDRLIPATRPVSMVSSVRGGA